MKHLSRSFATRLIACVLSLVMVFAMVPVGAFAESSSLEKEFEAAINPMFEGISSKEGVYDASFNADKRIVTVKILDKTKEAKEISGTGLASGLKSLYEDHNVKKIKIGSLDERDLVQLANNAPASGMTVEQIFKLIIGADVLNEAQKTGEKTGKLADFIDKTVELKLTVEKDGETAILTYIINGVDGTKTDAERNPAVDPEKVEVSDPDNLTDAERFAVAANVLEANPEAQEVKVDDKGNATIKYEDGSENTLSPEKTIMHKTVSIDASDVKPVKPTNDAQDTGIKIENPGDDTKVTAKDKDGKDVPVEINKDGKVIVKPGTEVSGPITVVIANKGLPEGKKIIEVPVTDVNNGSGDIWLRPNGPKKNETKEDKKDEQKVEKRETSLHKAYIFGYEDGTFRAEGNVTRAEAAAMIARLKGLDMSNTEKPAFNDVQSAWYNAGINAVVKAGYMKGYPDGKFNPNGKITRAEFAQLIMAIDKANGADVPFTDVKGHWAETAIKQAFANERIAGYPDNSFRPNNHITRAEAVTVLNKLFDRSVSAKGLVDVQVGLAGFKDLEQSHWAYYQIIEASNTHDFFRTEQGKVDETWVKLLKNEKYV